MKDEQTSPQLQCRSYRLGALDPDFLLGEFMRGVRFLLMTLGLEPHSSIELAAEQSLEAQRRNGSRGQGGTRVHPAPTSRYPAIGQLAFPIN